MTIDVDTLFDQIVAPGTSRERGPMRPERLLSVRERQSRRLAAHTFRAVDLLAIVGISVTCASAASDATFAHTSVAVAAPFVVGALLFGRLLRGLGLYRFGRSEVGVGHIARTVAAALLVLPIMALVEFWLVDDTGVLRAVLAWFVVCGGSIAVLHAVWSSFVGRWRTQGWLTPNVVVVGATAHAQDLIGDAIAQRNMNVIGVFDDRRERSPFAVLGVPVLGDSEALLSHKIVPFLDLIVIAVDPAASERVRELTARLSVLPNKVSLIFEDGKHASRAAAISQIADAPLAPINSSVDDDRRAVAKRAQDLLLGLPILILAAPVMAAVALAVRLDSPGPVFFRQRRHGFNNEEITVWKFRTMRQDAADAKAERQVTANDDRVTRVGRFLRKTSLDELPQLFNVLNGEMSLVGPRPHAIGMKTGDVESARLVAEYAHRHRIKPGMTGWAAINGSRGPLHGADEVGRRVALDVEYIDRQSFLFDLRIMATTVPGMLGDRGAVR